MVEGGENLYRLAADLGAGAERVGAKAAAVLRRSASQVERLAKEKAPVDTGALRGSIGTDITGDGRAAEMTATVGPTVDYARFVEGGTARMSPQPYMAPALAAVEPEFTAAMAAIVDPLEPQ